MLGTMPLWRHGECKFLIDSVVASAMGHVAPEMTVGDLKGGRTM